MGQQVVEVGTTRLTGWESFWYILMCILTFGAFYFMKVSIKQALAEVAGESVQPIGLPGAAPTPAAPGIAGPPPPAFAGLPSAAPGAQPSPAPGAQPSVPDAPEPPAQSGDDHDNPGRPPS